MFNKEKIKTPKSIKIFLLATILLNLISISGIVFFDYITKYIIVLNKTLINTFIFSTFASSVLFITEMVGLKEYKSLCNKRKKIAQVFNNNYDQIVEIDNEHSLMPKENNNINYDKVRISFTNCLYEKNYSHVYSTDILYKIILGMKQSGYTVDEIAEYIIFLIDNERKSQTLSKDIKTLKKIKEK